MIRRGIRSRARRVCAAGEQGMQAVCATKRKEFAMFNHIMVPTDGTVLARQAARTAAELARLTGARMTAFYVAPAYKGGARPGDAQGVASPSEYADRVQEEAQRYLAEVARIAQEAGVACDTRYAMNDFTAEAIVKGAEQFGCDTIVMGSDWTKGVNKVGSVAQKVLTEARIPVLVT
jgi:nucleotide-binding universal stress UspA family protein